MACPFFMPTDLLTDDCWEIPPRQPLGASFRGTCHARPGESFEPAESDQRALCNCGYARGLCSRFPSESGVDAVRFSLAGERLIYILEKNHVPAEFGDFEPSANVVLAAQADAFLRSRRELSLVNGESRAGRA